MQTAATFLIVIGIIGTLFTFFTKTEREFGSVWGKCIGVGIFILVLSSFGVL